MLDYNCESAYCTACYNQSAFLQISTFGGQATNIYLYGFEDVCVACSNDRLPPFCICDDGASDVLTVDWTGYGCIDYTTADALKTATLAYVEA